MSRISDEGKRRIGFAVRENRLSHATLIIADSVVCRELVDYAASLIFQRQPVSEIPDYKRIDASGLKVAGADELLSELTVTPSLGKRIIALENAGGASEAVQNMLLKTIEEPPPHNYFFLYGKESGILPTIRSRCALLDLGQMTFSDIAEYLAEKGVSESEAEYFAYLSDGSAQTAQRLAEDEDYMQYTLSCAELFCTIKIRSLICDSLRDIAATDAMRAVCVFEMCLSDMRRLKLGLPLRFFTRDPQRQSVILCADRLSEKEISDIAVLLRDVRAELNTNAPAKQVFDNFAAKTEQVVGYGR